MWPDRRLMDLCGTDLPFVQAPMAGAMDHELAIAAAEAGALGVLPCAMLSEAQVREQAAKFRAATAKPLGLAFFCHSEPVPNNEREARWRDCLAPYYRELAIDPAAPVPSSSRNAFDARMCDVVEEIRPEVASFHFGLPSDDLMRRVKSAGCKISRKRRSRRRRPMPIKRRKRARPHLAWPDWLIFFSSPGHTVESRTKSKRAKQPWPRP